MKTKLGLLAFFLSISLLESKEPVDISGFKEPVRVACVGDSITAGVGAEQDNSYPTQLGRMLGARWTVLNLGASGATLLNHGDKPYQKDAAFKRALEFRPNVVVIKLGTNDTKAHNWRFKDEFLTDYKGLISQFAQLPTQPRIFICHPAFVAGDGNFGINEAGVLEELKLIDQIAAATKADVVDIHGALQGQAEMLPDRVHPNNAGATVIAKEVFRALTGIAYSGSAPVILTGPNR